MPTTDALMIQGSTSDAGKSTLVAGLARALYRRGISVAPFKPQNMALNSAVTTDGGEIGRAQALQALAAGLTAHTDFNPVLLKPSTDIGAQVIIHGQAVAQLSAKDYHAYKPIAMQAVMQSWQRLKNLYGCLLVEGAGSPAEINLRDRDIANMGFAEAADIPVVLIADIDKGGVFAHLAGTLALLAPSERERVKGFVINRFRGDIALLQSGLDWLEHYTGKPVLGVLPYLKGLYLDAEDAVAASHPLSEHSAITVIAPAFPRISNHTDLDALRLHPCIDFRWIRQGETIPPADLVILPGSKSVINDLHWLQAQGWPAYLARHLRYGGKLLGICGGFQMLGQRINDPCQLEGTEQETLGLGWLDMHTELRPHKTLRHTAGQIQLGPRAAHVEGYEIHMGISHGKALQNPWISLADNQTEGARSDDNQIIGTYLHGLFDHPDAAAAILDWAGATQLETIDLNARREHDLNRLADCIEQHIDLQQLAVTVGWQTAFDPG